MAPRRGAESERLPGHATGTSFLRRAEERGQLRPAVGDAGNDGSHEKADIEPGGGQAAEGAEPGVRGGGAGLDAPDQPPLEGGERDVNAHGVPLGELDQEVDVPGDERRLGDDAEVEPAVREERLEQPAGDPEAALGRLVGIGGGADDDGRAVDARGIEGAAEDGGRIDLDEDPVFEGSPHPWPRFAVLTPCPPLHHVERGDAGTFHPFHGPAVGVPGVAVGAAEFAADVGIDRPERHVGGRGAVEHRAGRDGFEGDGAASRRSPRMGSPGYRGAVPLSAAESGGRPESVTLLCCPAAPRPRCPASVIRIFPIRTPCR